MIIIPEGVSEAPLHGTAELTLPPSCHLEFSWRSTMWDLLGGGSGVQSGVHLNLLAPLSPSLLPGLPLSHGGKELLAFVPC